MEGTSKTNFPEKLKPLFEKSRYKVLYGGRGGTKSWGIAKALLILGSRRPLRILCARELQKSIKDSVHRLLSDQVKLMQLDGFYNVQGNKIEGRNGTAFFFEGLRHNAYQIKSYEGIDIVWVEEAVSVSKSSWDFLIPTIRKEESEIWMSFNPELEEDETYQRFVMNPPANSIVIELGWRDNPWFTKVLQDEMDDLKRRDPRSYLNVWEGECRQTIEGAIYAEEMELAKKNGRITNVPYDRSKPVNNFWDLGWADCTSIWFIQKIGFEYHAIDFYQNSHKFIDHYAKILQERKYVYGIDYLPHDGNANHLGSQSIKKTLQDYGRTVEIVPAVSVNDGLHSVRAVFNVIYFDRAKCADGLQALRRYKYNVNDDKSVTSRLPLHDVNSHAADGLKTFGTAPNIMWDTYITRPDRATKGKQAITEYDIFRGQKTKNVPKQQFAKTEYDVF